MAFIVQNKDGDVEGANSYISVIELDTYLADRGVVTTKTEAEKEQLLIRSTDFLDNTHTFIGKPTNEDNQTTKLPVSYSTNDYSTINSEIPMTIKNAVCEYFIALDNGLSFYRNINPAESGIKKYSRKVGSLSKTTEYKDSSNFSNTIIVQNAENYIKRSNLLLTQSNSIHRS